MSLKRTTLTDSQKRSLCNYACTNKKTRTEYVNWVEEQWGLRVNESTISQILKTGEKRLIAEPVSPDKHVLYPALELLLKEFVLNYQHCTVLSDAILIEKARKLAGELEIP